MKLQLYLDDWLFNEMHLPDVWNRIDDTGTSWQDNVDYRAHMLQAYVEDFKGMFWPQISKVKKWEIVFVAESKLNNQSNTVTEHLPASNFLKFPTAHSYQMV